MFQLGTASEGIVHKSTLTQETIANIVRRRGRFEIFDALDADRTALVVIDMQKAFVQPGAPVEVETARGIVPNINALAKAARRAGALVSWVKMTVSKEDGRTSWPVFYDHFTTPEFARRHLEALSRGAELHELAEGLDVAPEDLVVEKLRFSAFIQGSSDLDAILRQRGIDTLVIAGTLTNRCCESTGRDAMMIGYKVVFVEDANAALSDEEHVAALVNMATAFGDVRRTADVVAMLDAAGG